MVAPAGICDGRSEELSTAGFVLVRSDRIAKISKEPIPRDRRADTKIIDGALVNFDT